ncbi:hypothetical protein [Bradyrhizobium sp.]|uniref:hypothetical protein n=1 Tax=Bradyrhizobium sp. TaxID=376 RepID=UPI003C7420B2
MIDDKVRTLAKPNRCILTQTHLEPGRRSGANVVANKEGRCAVQRAVLAIGIGERLAFDLFDLSNRIRTSCIRYLWNQESNCRYGDS